MLADDLGRRFHSGTFLFESAGITPYNAEDAENAVSILRDHFRIDASDHQPRDVRNVDLAGFEMVIAIGSNAADVVEALGIPKSKLIVGRFQIPGAVTSRSTLTRLWRSASTWRA